MIRLPLEKFERAARDLAKTRDKDPDEMSFYLRPGKAASGAKRPFWMNLAEQLRSHYECDIALERDGL